MSKRKPNSVCVCAACGATAPWRVVSLSSSGNNAHQVEFEDRLPLGWCREFYAKDPQEPKKNRILCKRCEKTERVQRGTVRFKAIDK